MRLIFSIAILLSAWRAFPAAIIVAEGDSLTAGYGLTPAGSNWVGQLINTYPSATWTNVAESGKRWETGWSPDVEASNTTNHLASHTVGAKRTVVIWCGINDIAGGNSFTATTNLMRQWIDAVRGFDANAKILGCTILKYVGMSGGQETIRSDLNTLILTGGWFDYTCDLASAAELDDPSDLTYFQADGVHTTIAGNVAVAREVSTVLLANDRIYSTYYVRTDGNNSNGGVVNSSGGAWLTIQKAADTMFAGDVVNVASGTYSENVTTRRDGTATARIVFQSSGATLRSFHVTNAYAILQGFTLNGVSASVAAITSNGDGITTFGSGHRATIQSNTFINSVASLNSMTIFGTNWLIASNRFLDTWGGCLEIAGKNTVITNNFFSNTNGADLFRNLGSSHHFVDNRVSVWASRRYTNGQPLNIGVRYYFDKTNLFGGGPVDFENVGAGPPPYGEGESFNFFATGTTPTAWGGARVEVSNHPDIIQASTSYGSYVVTNLLFERNIIEDGPPDVENTNQWSSTQIGNIEDRGNTNMIHDWTFRNNLWIKISNTMNLGASKFKFYNETFAKCAFNSGQVISQNVGAGGSATNNTYLNCIAWHCGRNFGTFAGDDGFWGGTDGTNGMLSDYNLIVGQGSGTTKTGTFGAVGMDTHSINGSDPSFVDSDNSDFRLRVGSLALNAGTNLLSIFTTDILGASRDSTPSIGAYEEGVEGSSMVGTSGIPINIRLKR